MENVHILKTRSFWIIVVTIISGILQVFGSDVIIEPESFVDIIMPLVTSAFALWAYLERIFGKKKVVFIIEKKENNGK